MKKTILLLVLCISLVIASAQSINYEGKNIFINGANVPWVSFGSDVGCNYSASSFEGIFEECQQYGINCLRLWIHCDGRCNPLFDATGTVSGLNPSFFANLDDIFLRAKNHNIMIMPCLWSFDMLKTNMSSAGKYAGKHADLITDSAKTASYIDTVLVPMVKRYSNQCNLFAWEIINEPEWGMNVPGVSSTDMQMVSANQMQAFVGKLAAVIHRNSKKMVTVGSASLKWNSTAPSCYGNYWSDSALTTASKDTLGFLDFYQVHYYSWMYPAFDPFNASRAYSYWNLDKPILLGEVDGNNSRYPPATMVNDAYRNKYCGLMYWSIAAGDDVATFSDFKIALSDFRIQHYDSVSFSCDTAKVLLDTILNIATNYITINTDSNSTAQLAISSTIAWKLTSNVSWLTFSCDSASVSKTVTITATSANSVPKERDAIITLSATGMPSQTITVIQSAPSLNASPNPVSLLPDSGSQATFTVYSNMTWNIVNPHPTWFSVTPNTANGQKTITVSSLTSVDSTLTDTVFLMNPRMKTIPIIINQVVPIIYVAFDSFSIDTSISVSVISNVNWNVYIQQAWLTASVASGSNDSVITFTAIKNNSDTSRSSIVTFWGTGVNPKTITIVQAPSIKGMLSVSPDSVTIDSSAIIKIASNVHWNVSSNKTWLTSSIMSGSNTADVIFTADTNHSDSSRTALATITGTDVTPVTITFTQAPTSTGIATVAAADFLIYPTVVKDKLHISLQNQYSAHITIYSSNGEPVYNTVLTNCTTTIEMNNYPSGLYFVKIVSQNEGITVRKFTKL